MYGDFQVPVTILKLYWYYKPYRYNVGTNNLRNNITVPLKAFSVEIRQAGPKTAKSLKQNKPINLMNKFNKTYITIYQPHSGNWKI